MGARRQLCEWAGMWVQAARLGNAEACVAAAVALDGLHRRRDAMEYWARAARAGHAPAMVRPSPPPSCACCRGHQLPDAPGGQQLVRVCLCPSLRPDPAQSAATPASTAPGVLPGVVQGQILRGWPQVLYGEAFYLGRHGLGQDSEEALRWLTRGAKALAPATAAALAGRRPIGAGRHWRSELLAAAEDEGVPGAPLAPGWAGQVHVPPQHAPDRLSRCCSSLAVASGCALTQCLRRPASWLV